MYRPVTDVARCLVDAARKRGVELDVSKVVHALSADGDPYPDDAMCEKLASGDPPSNLKSLYENLWNVIEPSVVCWRHDEQRLQQR